MAFSPAFLMSFFVEGESRNSPAISWKFFFCFVWFSGVDFSMPYIREVELCPRKGRRKRIWSQRVSPSFSLAANISHRRPPVFLDFASEWKNIGLQSCLVWYSKRTSRSVSSPIKTVGWLSADSIISLLTKTHQRRTEICCADAKAVSFFYFLINLFFFSYKVFS